MESIRQRCHDYIKHLGIVGEHDLIGLEKHRIANLLLAAETPNDVLELLVLHRKTLKTHRYTPFLPLIALLQTEDVKDWQDWFHSFHPGTQFAAVYIAGILCLTAILMFIEIIVITALIALVSLTAASLFYRQTIYLWKTDGQLFADELITLCQQENARLEPELARQLLEEQQHADAILFAERQHAEAIFIDAINNAFGQEHVDFDAWLDSLLALEPFAPQLFLNNGNTALHLLTKLPLTQDSDTRAKIVTVARHLKSLCYLRNNMGETPLFALKSQDPYQLHQTLSPTDIVDLGNQMQQIQVFLDTVKRSPKKSKHFLLLEGPAGTGKTHMVTSNFVAQGHKVYSWVSGAADDRYVGQLEQRIISFFSMVKNEAELNPHCFHFLFIDEIDSVCAEISGTPIQGHFDRSVIVKEFQKQLNDLQYMDNVVLVGATNFPNKMAKAMLDRAFRVIYPLPDEPARLKLLEHFFRQKSMSLQSIQRMAKLTSVWSTRQLLALVASIDDEIITEAILSQAYSQASHIVEADFKTTFPCSQLTLPLFTPRAADQLAPTLSNINPETTEAFAQIAKSLRYPELFNIRLHSLLYGPPGSGKTSAVRRFAQTCNQPFVVIESGVSLDELQNVLKYVQTVGNVIVFIDEIDKIASVNGWFREVLQEAMDGFNQTNMVIIGATNYPSNIARPVLDRFAQFMHVPALGEKDRSKLIVSILKNELHNAHELHLDEDMCILLNDDLKNPQNMELVAQTQNMSIRAIKSKIALFIGNLRVAYKEKQPSELITATYSDLLHYFVKNNAVDRQRFFSKSANSSEVEIKNHLPADAQSVFAI